VAITKGGSSRDWESRRQEILMVAAELFADSGFEGVSMRHIASASNMHMSTLYHYFPNKSQLYDDVCAWAFAYSSKLSVTALEGDEDIVVKLQRYVDVNVRFLLERGPAIRILEMELLFRMSSAALEFPSIMVMPVARLAEVMTTISPPLLEDFSPKQLACIIWDVIYGISRYTAANFRVMAETYEELRVEKISHDVWVIIKQILGIKH